MNPENNQHSAELYGWDPTWWSMPEDEWGTELSAQVAAFQLDAGLAVTGLVDEATFRRFVSWRQLTLGVPDPELEAEEAAEPPELGDAILLSGRRLQIPWQHVVTMDEEGGHGIERYYTDREKKQRSRFGPRKWGVDGVKRVGLHWTGTRSAAATWKYAWSKRRSVSTHFEIDWNGTIYQLVDLEYTCYHYGARWFNHSSVGVDLTNPVACGKAKQANKELVKLGQEERPIMEGWRLQSWKPRPFLGPTPVQLEALRALMWALHEHLGIPLEAPGDVASKPKLILRGAKFKPADCPAGWYHHAYGVKSRWDHLGVHLTTELEAAAKLGGARTTTRKEAAAPKKKAPAKKKAAKKKGATKKKATRKKK